jgi:hypothetical protein
MHELSDDFFDAFGSDSAEEDNSKANFDPENTPLWWPDACDEISLDNMESAKNLASQSWRLFCMKEEQEKV